MSNADQVSQAFNKLLSELIAEKEAQLDRELVKQEELEKSLEAAQDALLREHDQSIKLQQRVVDVENEILDVKSSLYKQLEDSKIEEIKLRNKVMDLESESKAQAAEIVVLQRQRDDFKAGAEVADAGRKEIAEQRILLQKLHAENKSLHDRLLKDSKDVQPLIDAAKDMKQSVSVAGLFAVVGTEKWKKFIAAVKAVEGVDS